jgi:hypothetical protein
MVVQLSLNSRPIVANRSPRVVQKPHTVARRQFKMDVSTTTCDPPPLHFSGRFPSHFNPSGSSDSEFCRQKSRFWTKLGAAISLLLVLAATLTAAEPNKLTPEQIADGWISLFDGDTLFAWAPTSDAYWKGQEGAIAVSSGKGGFLMTGAEFANYELHVEFRAPATTNSGIFLHTPLKPTDPATDCYELNIAPRDNPYPTGSLVERKKWASGLTVAGLASTPLMIGTRDKDAAGEKPAAKKQNVSTGPPERSSRSSPSSPAPLATVTRESDGWHAFDVRLNNDTVDIGLDRQRLYTFKDEKPLGRGHIGLQFREGPVAFRNIRLRPIGLKPMLNGKDLAGWDTSNVENSKFEVADNGELRVTNGRGILETEASYGDFVMQLDAYVDGDGLNSGIFFRSIPREYANGYESQIHNASKNNDPTKPTDFGTGAIYRRVPARRVVSKDREWFTKTIIATGPHMAVWVNGFQVTDWTDQRRESENPREGLRTKPGTISIQGHDPTTNLRFRRLRIAELPEKLNHGGTEDTEKQSK